MFFEFDHVPCLIVFKIISACLFKVLHILDGDMVMDTSYISTPSYDVGNRSGRLWSEPLQRQHHYRGPLLEESLESFSGKLSLDK